jgi:hypothetical protein
MMEYQNRILMREGSVLMGRTVHRMCNIVDMTGASTRMASRKARAHARAHAHSALTLLGTRGSLCNARLLTAPA